MIIDQALETVFTSDMPAIRKIISGYQKDDDLVEDLVQDTYLAAWEYRDTYDSSKSSLLTWVCNIAENTCIRSNRDENRMKRPDLVLGGVLGDVDEDDCAVEYYDQPLSDDLENMQWELDPAAQYEAEDSMAHAVSNMSTRQQEVFELRFQGYSHEEIASELGISVIYSKKLLNAAKEVYLS